MATSSSEAAITRDPTFWERFDQGLLRLTYWGLPVAFICIASKVVYELATLRNPFEVESNIPFYTQLGEEALTIGLAASAMGLSWLIGFTRAPQIPGFGSK